jgi:hypothetical protein
MSANTMGQIMWSLKGGIPLPFVLLSSKIVLFDVLASFETTYPGNSVVDSKTKSKQKKQFKMAAAQVSKKIVKKVKQVGDWLLLDDGEWILLDEFADENPQLVLETTKSEFLPDLTLLNLTENNSSQSFDSSKSDKKVLQNKSRAQ